MKKKMERANWISFSFSIIVFALIILGGIAIFHSVKNSSNGNNFVASASTITDSHYKGIKISAEISNDAYAPFAIQYPQSAYRQFNDEVSAYIQQAKESYIEAMASHKKAGHTTPGELNISFETIPHHSGSYTFVLLSATYTGEANGTTDIRSFHLHPETGTSLTIEDILESDVERLQLLSTKVRELLNDDPSLKDYLVKEEVNFHTEPKWGNYRNFALTDDTLIFYFNEYEIAAGAGGIPIVSVPLEDINELVAGEFQMTEEDLAKNDKSEQDAEKKQSTKDETVQQEDETSQTHGNEGTSSVKKVALTFDDGPHPKVTPQILDILQKHDAKATFFMLGSRIDYYPEIAKQVKEAGHELGNHSWTHPDLTKSDNEKIHNEINRTSSIIEQVTGEKATAFRPPYGAVNDAVRAQTDLPVVLWDVDTQDWKNRDASNIVAHVKQQTKDGSIILMHDIHQSTADGLEAVLNFLHSEGYTFVTVSEIQQ